jgi:hypothetical protein
MIQFGNDPPPRFEIGGFAKCFDHGVRVAFDQRAGLSSPFKPSENPKSQRRAPSSRRGLHFFRKTTIFEIMNLEAFRSSAGIG